MRGTRLERPDNIEHHNTSQVLFFGCYFFKWNETKDMNLEKSDLAAFCADVQRAVRTNGVISVEIGVDLWNKECHDSEFLTERVRTLQTRTDARIQYKERALQCREHQSSKRDTARRWKSWSEPVPWTSKGVASTRRAWSWQETRKQAPFHSPVKKPWTIPIRLHVQELEKHTWCKSGRDSLSYCHFGTGCG